MQLPRPCRNPFRTVPVCPPRPSAMHRREFRIPRIACLLGLVAVATVSLPSAFTADVQNGRSRSPLTGHPRLYFTSADLPRLRSLRTTGVSAQIWANLTASADWCARQTPRKEWISTIAPDPIFENLYDRFYAAMHDMAIIEHLAFASALSDRDHDPYFEPARRWALAGATML